MAAADHLTRRADCRPRARPYGGLVTATTQDSTARSSVRYVRFGVRRPRPRTTVAEAIDEFLAAGDEGLLLDAEGRPLGPGAVRELHWYLGGYARIALGDQSLTTVRPWDLEDLIDDLADAGLSPHRVRALVAALVALYRHEIERGHATRNPADALPAREPTGAGETTPPLRTAPHPLDRIAALGVDAVAVGVALVAVALVVQTV
jgi:hypothetical protein